MVHCVHVGIIRFPRNGTVLFCVHVLFRVALLSLYLSFSSCGCLLHQFANKGSHRAAEICLACPVQCVMSDASCVILKYVTPTDSMTFLFVRPVTVNGEHARQQPVILLCLLACSTCGTVIPARGSSTVWTERPLSTSIYLENFRYLQCKRLEQTVLLVPSIF